jgi:hypothetical protein
LPLALQYGQSLDEFWFGEPELLHARQTAYMRDTSYKAWLNGAYMFEAVSKAIYNGFGRTKKTDEPQQYSQWVEPFKRQNFTKGNLEEQFRRQQYEQNAWLFGSK